MLLGQCTMMLRPSFLRPDLGVIVALLIESVKREVIEWEGSAYKERVRSEFVSLLVDLWALEDCSESQPSGGIRCVAAIHSKAADFCSAGSFI